MTARAQMEQVKLQELSLKNMSITYALIQSFIKQLTPVVKQCFFHACNKSDHLQLRSETPIILQFLRCFGNVTSWNICLYETQMWDKFRVDQITSKALLECSMRTSMHGVSLFRLQNLSAIITKVLSELFHLRQ